MWIYNKKKDNTINYMIEEFQRDYVKVYCYLTQLNSRLLESLLKSRSLSDSKWGGLLFCLMCVRLIIIKVFEKTPLTANVKATCLVRQLTNHTALWVLRDYTIFCGGRHLRLVKIDGSPETQSPSSLPDWCWQQIIAPLSSA